MPRRKRIDADVRQLRMKPKLWYRGYQFFYSEPLNLIIQRLDWMVRNGLNYVMFMPQRDDILGKESLSIPQPDTPREQANSSLRRAGGRARWNLRF